jgi:hypothetical protein
VLAKKIRVGYHAVDTRPLTIFSIPPPFSEKGRRLVELLYFVLELLQIWKDKKLQLMQVKKQEKW